MKTPFLLRKTLLFFAIFILHPSECLYSYSTIYCIFSKNSPLYILYFTQTIFVNKQSVDFFARISTICKIPLNFLQRLLFTYITINSKTIYYICKKISSNLCYNCFILIVVMMVLHLGQARQNLLLSIRNILPQQS